jgi:hypothetical protein
MNSQRLGACFSSSPSFDEDRLPSSQHHRRVLGSVPDVGNGAAECRSRPGWPRNYSCRIRAPEPVETTRRQGKNDYRETRVKTMAKHWEEQFENIMRDGPKGPVQREAGMVPFQTPACGPDSRDSERWK